MGVCDACGVITTINRFVQAQDDGDFKAVVDCMTEDVVMEIIGFPSGGIYSGKQEVFEMLSGVRSMKWATDWFKGPDKGRKHLSLNPVVDIHDDTAVASTDFVMCIINHPAEGGIVGVTAGRYLDRLRRDGDRWLICERKLVAQVPGIAQEHGPPHQFGDASA
jgi:ketosteroid isomerase-like protein